MTVQVWYCGHVGTALSGANHYPISGTGTSSLSSSDVMAIPAPCGVTFGNLSVQLSTAPGGVTARIFTLWVNGSSTSLAVTITGSATSATDTTHTIHLNAGDFAEWRGTNTGSPAAGRVLLTYETTTDNATDSIQWGIGQNFNTGTGAAHATPLAGGCPPSNGVAEGNAVFPAAVNGTISAIYAYDNVDPGSDGTRGYDCQLRINTANAGSAIQLRGSTRGGNATGLSISFSAGDLICWTWTNIVGANTSTHIGFAICYQSTTVPMLAGVDSTGAAATTTQYAAVQTAAGVEGGGAFNGSGSGDPASAVLGGITTLTLQGLRVHIASAVPGSSSVTYALYHASTGVLNSTVTLTAGQTSGTDSTHSDVITSGELLEMRHTTTGSGSGAAVGWCFGLSNDKTAALTGVVGTGSTGSLGVIHTNDLTGVTGSGATGTLSPVVSVTLAGVEATGAVGILTPHSSGGGFTGFVRVAINGQVITLATVPEANAPSTGGAWLIERAGVTYAVQLVAVDDPNASPVHIQTTSGVWAARLYP